ncbi:hypothetical protein GPX89_14980 [Nocardia sp. ET3-3]|uniref:Uncharacterized protein n=1 Tax=Nocardia terrae TaxID=2675851 RepID=A0A7K1UVX8_9NOCA|nr:hypothetical protein [Nocardia terrae]MVU78546.1 hypothetical protein [Nocardia terrae]
MEILTIIGLVVVVALVIAGRRFTGRGRETDLSTGNPPSSKNVDDI